MDHSSQASRILYIIGFALFTSYVIGLLSLPAYWGYVHATPTWEVSTACLEIACVMVLYGILWVVQKKGGIPCQKMVLLAILTGCVTVFAISHLVSIATSGVFSLPYIINVLLFAFITLLLFLFWAKLSSDLSIDRLCLDVPLALILSSVFGTGLSWLTASLNLYEGSLFMLIPFASTLFLLPLVVTNKTRELVFGLVRSPKARISSYPEFAVFIILLVYILCTSIFYSVLTEGMAQYSLQYAEHRVLGFCSLIVLLVLMQVAKKKDQFLPYGVVFFVTACIACLYCISLFGLIDFQAARTLLLMTRSLALFISFIVLIQLACREQCPLEFPFAFVLLPVVLASRALMFGAWDYLQILSSLVDIDLLIMVLALGSSFFLTIGCFFLMFSWGRAHIKQAKLRETPAPLESDESIAVIRDTYNLSAREAEVIFYISQGNTRKAIAKKLYLSENSIATYSKSAYGKMGIHSRQEAIDLISGLLAETDVASVNR